MALEVDVGSVYRLADDRKTENIIIYVHLAAVFVTANAVTNIVIACTMLILRHKVVVEDVILDLFAKERTLINNLSLLV